MTTNPIITDLITLINKIASLEEAGVNISYEEKDTSFVYRNKDTDRIIDTVKLSRLKSISYDRKSDPRVEHIIGFFAGGDICAARDAIKKLENLKAFW